MGALSSSSASSVESMSYRMFGPCLHFRILHAGGLRRRNLHRTPRSAFRPRSGSDAWRVLRHLTMTNTGTGAFTTGTGAITLNGATTAAWLKGRRAGVQGRGVDDVVFGKGSIPCSLDSSYAIGSRYLLRMVLEVNGLLGQKDVLRMLLGIYRCKAHPGVFNGWFWFHRGSGSGARCLCWLRQHRSASPHGYVVCKSGRHTKPQKPSPKRSSFQSMRSFNAGTKTPLPPPFDVDVTAPVRVSGSVIVRARQITGSNTFTTGLGNVELKGATTVADSLLGTSSGVQVLRTGGELASGHGRASFSQASYYSVWVPT